MGPRFSDRCVPLRSTLHAFAFFPSIADGKTLLLLFPRDVSHLLTVLLPDCGNDPLVRKDPLSLPPYQAGKEVPSPPPSLPAAMVFDLATCSVIIKESLLEFLLPLSCPPLLLVCFLQEVLSYVLPREDYWRRAP